MEDYHGQMEDYLGEFFFKFMVLVSFSATFVLRPRLKNCFGFGVITLITLIRVISLIIIIKVQGQWLMLGESFMQIYVSSLYLNP